MNTNSSLQQEKESKKSIIEFLDKYLLRSFTQVLIHTCVAIGLALLLYFLLRNRVSISSDVFVTIMSAIAAASGALLAVSLAFGTFMGRYITDWREMLIERLSQGREKLSSQMKFSAQRHSEISRRLTALYIIAALYIPGQEIDKDKVYEADKIFHDWCTEQALRSNTKIDFGKLASYDSFEKHLFDAHLCSNEVRENLIELHVVERLGRSLASFPPLITTWAIILAFALVLAIIGSTGIIYSNLSIPLLIILVYLVMFATFALILDFRGSIGIMRILETGYKKAKEQLEKMRELVSKPDSDPKS